MRRWLIALAIAAVGIAVLIALGGKSVLRSQNATVAEQQATVVDQQAIGERQPPAAERKAEGLAGIDTERKRRILNAAAACSKADFFRRTGATASLSEVQRRNFESAELLCQSDPAARTAPIGDFLVDLARSGNVSAGACYIAGGMRSTQHAVAPPDDPIYRQLVPKLIEVGLAAGDWSTVSIAASIEAPRQAGSPYTHLPPPRPEINYLYTKLLELGATGDEKSDLQSILADKSKALSPAQKKSAEVGAEELYRAHFARGPAYRHGAKPQCEGF